MTTAQLDTLKAALKGELRRQEGEDPPAHPNTLGSLVRRGLLERSRRFSRHETRMDVWIITDAGRDALKPPERFVVERDVYLGQVGCELGDDVDDELREKGYTTNPRRRIDHLPVAGLASTVWQRKSAEKKVATMDRKQRARKAAEKARYAA